MRRLAIPAVVVAAIRLAACSQPAAPGASDFVWAPRFSIESLEVHDFPGDASLWVGVRAVLYPGMLSGGSEPRLADRCAYIMGYGFCPTAPDHTYRASALLPELAWEVRPFLRAPAVEGLPTPPELWWSLPRRVGPDTLTAGEAGIVLRMTPPSGGAEEIITGWTVSVPIIPPPFRGPGDRIVQGEMGPPPAEVVIPATDLQFLEPVPVVLSYGLRFDGETARSGGYVLGGSASALASSGGVYTEWTVMPRRE